jgi:hypothetical protein
MHALSCVQSFAICSSAGASNTLLFSLLHAAVSADKYHRTNAAAAAAFRAAATTGGSCAVLAVAVAAAVLARACHSDTASSKLVVTCRIMQWTQVVCISVAVSLLLYECCTAEMLTVLSTSACTWQLYIMQHLNMGACTAFQLAVMLLQDDMGVALDVQQQEVYMLCYD